jgi:hypothetical protein
MVRDPATAAHSPNAAEAEEIFDDQAEALAPEPVERLKHGFRRRGELVKGK